MLEERIYHVLASEGNYQASSWLGPYSCVHGTAKLNEPLSLPQSNRSLEDTNLKDKFRNFITTLRESGGKKIRKVRAFVLPRFGESHVTKL